MNNIAAVQAGLERTKRPCRYCGRVMRKPNMSTHEPACSPERREARRIRQLLHARVVRERPGYVKPPEKRDVCPGCGQSKLVRSAACQNCYVRGAPVRPLADRFWEHVDRRGPDECWPWIGAKRFFGYGAFNIGKKKAKGAHRVAWELTNGPIPDGLQALHRCDNPPCVNPAHLFLGTPRDNMRDAQAKGRTMRGDAWYAARPGLRRLGGEGMSGTQVERLVAYLRSHPGASGLEIVHALSLPKYTSRISDARKQGFDIICATRPDGNKGYTLREQPVQLSWTA